MKFSILHKIPGFGVGPVGQVAGREPAAATVRQLLAELPELLLVAVLDARSGEVQAGLASARSYQPLAVAGPALAIARQLGGLLAAQGQPPAALGEVVCTLSTQLHVLCPTPDGRHLLYLAADAHDTNLAILRQLATEAAHSLGNQLLSNQ